MSGPKQHYIPQSFQRPFKIMNGKKADKVWVYRKDKRGPYPDSIANVAAERFFYSDLASSDAKTLDDAITEYENRLAVLLRRLRSLSHKEAVPSKEAAEVIAHLTTRAKTIRSLARDGFSGLLEKISSLIKKGFDENSFPAAPIPLGLHTMLAESIAERTEVAELNLKEATLARVAYAYGRENADTLLENARTGMGTLTAIAEKFDFRSIHSKSMDSMFPENAADQYSDMNWRIVDIESDDAILPDCIGIASEDGVDFEPILGSGKGAKLFIIPIQPNKVLIAENGLECDFDIHKFNDAAAACSTELFISNQKNQRLEAALSMIGQVSHSVISGAIDEAVDEFTVKLSAQEARVGSKSNSASDECVIRFVFPSAIASSLKNHEMEELASKLFSVLSPESREVISSFGFDDQQEACKQYVEERLSKDLQQGSYHVRSDGVCAILPSSAETGKQEVHVNHAVLELFLDQDQVEAAIDYIKRAECDLLLVPIFERFDNGDFAAIDQHFLSYAIRALRLYNRNRVVGGADKDSLKLADEIRRVLSKTWSAKEFSEIMQRSEDQSQMVSEIAERMAYSMVLLAEFVECTSDHLEPAASNLCDSPEFLRWARLFQADMNLAIKWLREDQSPEAGLIAAAHFERLMFGTGILFEETIDGDLRYEMRGGFPEHALPLPFRAILDLEV